MRDFRMADFIAKLLGLSIAIAMQAAPYSSSTPQVAIGFWADLYGADAAQMYTTAQCESGFDPSVQSRNYSHGKREQSYGVAQINLPAHPEITKKQALDPQFALSWMAQQFALGTSSKEQWSCWRSHFES